MKKLFLILIALFLGSVAIYYWLHPPGAKIVINGHTIPIELAVTQNEKAKGLGERDSLTPGSGMLFVYDHEEQHPFWMKGMRFPIDFVWIREKVVIDITEAAQPEPGKPDTALTIYHPRIAVDKVLELNAGDVQRFGITIGSTVQFITK